MNPAGAESRVFQLISEPTESRQGRVDDIRRRVAAGRYSVPADDVAESVVAFFSRRLGLAAPDDAGSQPDTC